jgi:hypothetical protein
MGASKFGANRFFASFSEMKFALNVSRCSVARVTFDPKASTAWVTDLALISGWEAVDSHQQNEEQDVVRERQ